MGLFVTFVVRSRKTDRRHIQLVKREGRAPPWLLLPRHQTANDFNQRTDAGDLLRVT